jgi:hypothetical protein
LAPATVVAPHYHFILFLLNWLFSSLLRPGSSSCADGSHHFLWTGPARDDTSL